MKSATDSWKTKPSDRFILKWIKLFLSAPLTLRLAHITWLQPWMITLVSSLLGVIAGIVFACGLGGAAGLIALSSQILDGVDGQFARLTKRESPAGAYLDSVLDRYADGALMIGIFFYLLRIPMALSINYLLAIGSLALIGSNLISYSGARAESLNINLGKPTLASKGTRMTVMIVSGFGSAVWKPFPIIGLCYLAIHPNIAVVYRIFRSMKAEKAC
ncbi:MAG: CDP-alcohol phosphatidyltransferase family protein [Deltaproteobacteria bacterium]|nr:CDP-alcohol phosphatidyltransferase family protein [Deltaproteobacteria bacterium]